MISPPKITKATQFLLKANKCTDLLSLGTCDFYRNHREHRQLEMFPARCHPSPVLPKASSIDLLPSRVSNIVIRMGNHDNILHCDLKKKKSEPKKSIQPTVKCSEKVKIKLEVLVKVGNC